MGRVEAAASVEPCEPGWALWGRVVENGTFVPSCRESQLKLNYCIYVPPLRMIVSLRYYNQVKRSCRITE